MAYLTELTQNSLPMSFSEASCLLVNLPTLKNIDTSHQFDLYFDYIHYFSFEWGIKTL